MRVLFVCTGNTCRSPMAEGYLKSKHITGLEVGSFGVYANLSPVSENSVAVMREIGIDISSHISKPADSTINSADLIYCMSQSHRSMLIHLGIDENRVFLLGGGIPDPFGGSIEVYRNCRDCIIKAIDALVESGAFYDFSIDTLKPEFVEQIAELESICFSEPWSAKAINDSFLCGTQFFVAHKNGRVLGYAGINSVLDEGYITNVAVFPEHRKKGVARALMLRIKQFCEAKHLAFVSLEVRQSNNAAITLYESLNYKKEGLRKGFYRNPSEDAIIMTKRFVNDENT